jgi:hypothetical protein
MSRSKWRTLADDGWRPVARGGGDDFTRRIGDE